MLLHAAERDVGRRSVREKLRLARETAAENLGETRRFIRELTPPSLDVQTLPAALSRLARATTTQAEQAGSPVRVEFVVSGDAVVLPMATDAALLRIAQGSLANVLQHADATQASLTLSYLGDEIALDVVDDGVGFDAAGVAAPAAEIGDFGLRAIRRRAEQLGGTFEIETAPGEGTALSVRIPVVAA